MGKWVIRTALSVVLTCWPPAPLDLYVSILKSFLNKQRGLYRNMDAKALEQVVQRTHGRAVRENYRSEQAAWIMLARVLLNLDETITRE